MQLYKLGFQLQEHCKVFARPTVLCKVHNDKRIIIQVQQISFL